MLSTDMEALAALASIYRNNETDERRRQRRLHQIHTKASWDTFWSLGVLCDGPR